MPLGRKERVVKALRLVDLRSSDAAKAAATLRHLADEIRSKYVSMGRFYKRGTQLAIVVECFRTIQLTEIPIDTFAQVVWAVSSQLARIQSEDLSLITKILSSRALDRNVIPVLYVCPSGVTVCQVDRLSLIVGGAA